MMLLQSVASLRSDRSTNPRPKFGKLSGMRHLPSPGRGGFESRRSRHFSSVLGDTRRCLNTGLHIVAPQRSKHVANEPVAAAKWLELVGPADHCATAVGSVRPFST